MKGYVTFTDGHREDILEGTEFDDATSPYEVRYIMVQTKSGFYRKTIWKVDGASACFGFRVAPGYTYPLPIRGQWGIVDIVVERTEEYSYHVSVSDTCDVCGKIEVPVGATLDDVRLAILDKFNSVKIRKVEDGKG